MWKSLIQLGKSYVRETPEMEGFSHLSPISKAKKKKRKKNPSTNHLLLLHLHESKGQDAKKNNKQIGLSNVKKGTDLTLKFPSFL